jgi:DNA-directed RNA polymerase specialized sigma24 family protein
VQQPDAELADVCKAEFPRLVGLLALRVGDRQVAQQLAEDTLVQLCLRWPDVRDPAAWLTRTALNLSSSWFRRRYAEQRAYRRLAPAGSTRRPWSPTTSWCSGRRWRG